MSEQTPVVRMEDIDGNAQELAVRDKKELVSKEEKTSPAATTYPMPTSTRPMRRSRS